MNHNKYSFHSGKYLCINYYIIVTAISHQILGSTDILCNNNLCGSDRGSLMTTIWLFLSFHFLTKWQRHKNDLPVKYKSHLVEENYPKFGDKRKDSIMWFFTDKLEYCLTRPTRVYFWVWLVIVCLDILQTVWSEVLTCLFLFCRNGNSKKSLWVSCYIRHLPGLYLSNAAISLFL